MLRFDINEERQDENQSRLQAYCFAWVSGSRINYRKDKRVTHPRKRCHHYQPRKRILTLSAKELEERHHADTAERVLRLPQLGLFTLQRGLVRDTLSVDNRLTGGQMCELEEALSRRPRA
jgi:hypothetical protein